ncbi:general secretion pathway protein GspC [Photobacterium aquae]|uniref:General secretion pathway protein GspC n=1 Tax=Photobacterium aquae TaxID=1195763 RepID=A0A0J1H7U2_9GAMM|nr:type II secretion system protein GspC [Photobacterium aquae]KLV07779.1 general secretion pathway protein GspC [Photobacterium aquae]
MVTANWLGTLQSKQWFSISFLTRGLTWILVVMLAWILGRLVWSFVTPAGQPPRWQPSPVSIVASNPQNNGIANVLAMNLFGRYQPNVPVVQPKQPVKQDAPKTRLNLTLAGVVASNNPQLALAVITHRGKQNTYGLNEAIDGTRATLQAVFADRVIIRNGGRDETLMLDGVDFSQRQQAAVPAQQAKPAAKVNTGSELGRIKQEILDKPQSLFSYIRLSQVKRDGELVGYRVNPGKERALFDAVGLKSNDLAVSLNGHDLTDATVMAKLWTELAGAADFTLTVEREGQLHDIYIELQ